MFTPTEDSQIKNLIQIHLERQNKVKIMEKTDKSEENLVPPLEGQVPTIEGKWKRFWGFKRGQLFTTTEMREMYKNR